MSGFRVWSAAFVFQWAFSSIAQSPQDAIPRDGNGAGKSDPSKQSTTDGAPSEPAYAARVSLDQTQMQVDDKLLNLSPGMAVTVEIKTGNRRIIDYLLSPILRHSQESLRER